MYLLMFRLASAQLPLEEVRRYLNYIVEPFPRDSSKRLFAAMTCMKYGLYDEAAEHLQANIDLKQFDVITRTLLAEVYERQKNTDGQLALLQTLLRDESVTRPC